MPTKKNFIVNYQYGSYTTNEQYSHAHEFNGLIQREIIPVIIGFMFGACLIP